MNGEEWGADYEWLGRCTYPVGTNVQAGIYEDVDAPCDEPAIVRVWWRDYDIDFMLLCPEHWEVVKQEEGIK